jgi:hypothetical protein
MLTIQQIKNAKPTDKQRKLFVSWFGEPPLLTGGLHSQAGQGRSVGNPLVSLITSTRIADFDIELLCSSGAWEHETRTGLQASSRPSRMRVRCIPHLTPVCCCLK